MADPDPVGLSLTAASHLRRVFPLPRLVRPKPSFRSPPLSDFPG